jgi:phosphate-selective porin OprO/OprP
MVDTGAIAARDQWLLGLEYCYVRGPFSLQGEYGWTWITGAFGVAPTGLTLNPAITPSQDYMFNGGYIQLAYTLTGEARGYDRARGTLARPYFNGGPFSSAWLVRDEDGNLNWGLGAWEVAVRYSYLDLNNGTGLNRIQGGRMDGLSVALNWYLNANVTCMFDWVYDRRYDLPTGTIPGHTSGLGMRVQLSF